MGNREIIIFYERQYLEFIKNGVGSDVIIKKWIPLGSVEDVDVFFKESVQMDESTYIGFMVSNRAIKTRLYELMSAWKVCAKQVLDIYKMYMAGYSTRRYQRIMNQKLDENLDGIVLGISHGMVGIVEEKMPGNVCNLCYSSQDIYFNYKTLKKCVDEYYWEIKDIKYAVIDMFDYFYFNFDTILTGAYDIFLEKSGFLCEERKSWNKSQSVMEINLILEQMWREGKGQEQQQLFYEFFPFARERDNGVFKEMPSYDHILTENDVLAYKEKIQFASPQTKVFEETIYFQINNMQKLLELLCWINSQIKIYMVLLPKYIVVEEAEMIINKEWKSLFMNIVNGFRERYHNIELIDLKASSNFSANREYYDDLTHFNHDGAVKFTEYLADLLTNKYGLKL